MNTAFQKLDLKIDALPLQQELKGKSHLYGRHTYRSDGPDSPHREMTDIWLRYKDVQPHIKSGDFSTFADEHDSVWYPAYYELQHSTKIIFDVMVAMKGIRLGGILITKLPAGKTIKPHVDGGWHANYYRKFYVPIENLPGAVFGFEQGDIKPELGEVYEFDNSQLHWVNNDSKGDRVAMIICLRSQV